VNSIVVVFENHDLQHTSYTIIRTYRRRTEIRHFKKNDKSESMNN